MFDQAGDEGGIEMKPLHPLNTYNGKYVSSRDTDIRKVFKAARKKLVREAHTRKRKEVRK